MSKINDKVKSNEAFPFYSFEGTHYEIGEQYGESCRDLIKLHKKYALERLSKSIDISAHKKLEDAALEYRPFVIEYAPFFDKEIQGLAKGADISLGEAYFLQLRAEIYNFFDTTDECTTFAVSGEVTKNGIPILGQNADLPSLYKEVGVVVESKYNNSPKTLMLTPAGQISYIGINDEGVAIGANFLECKGWKIGFPRYLLSKLALTKSNVKDAIKIIEGVNRASSRNLIMVDKANEMINLETIPGEIAEIKDENGILAHSNHFVSQQLLHEEGKEGEDLRNSELRLDRILSFLRQNSGVIDVERSIEIFRDRENFPHTLCREQGDFTESSDVITFASMIAEPTKGQLWIAIGPPSNYQYKKYSFS